jgi:hypothetical protein
MGNIFGRKYLESYAHCENKSNGQKLQEEKIALGKA